MLIDITHPLLPLLHPSYPYNEVARAEIYWMSSREEQALEFLARGKSISHFRRSVSSRISKEKKASYDYRYMVVLNHEFERTLYLEIFDINGDIAASSGCHMCKFNIR